MEYTPEQIVEIAKGYHAIKTAVDDLTGHSRIAPFRYGEEREYANIIREEVLSVLKNIPEKVQRGLKLSDLERELREWIEDYDFNHSQRIELVTSKSKA